MLNFKYLNITYLYFLPKRTRGVSDEFYALPSLPAACILLAHTQMERSEVVVVYNYKYLLARNEIAQRWTSTLCRSEVANDIQPYAFFVSLSNMIVLSPGNMICCASK